MQKFKLPKSIIWIFKLSIFSLAWWYVYYKLQTVSSDFTFLLSDARFSPVVMVIIFAFMLLNWALEAFKWQFLVNKIQKISFFKSVSGVFVGLPLALITPNRVGEIGGRAMVLPNNRKKNMFATFIGSTMQLIVTLFFGVFGFVVYTFFLPHESQINKASYISIILLFASVLLYFVFRKSRFVKLGFLRIVGRSNYIKISRIYRLYTMQDLQFVFLLSVLRYIVFATQFCLLVHIFIPQLSIFQLMVGVTLTYFFTTIIPTSILGEIGIRGSVAMFVFGFFTSQELVVFQVSLLVWLVNIVLPTLAGSFILLRIKKGPRT